MELTPIFNDIGAPEAPVRSSFCLYQFVKTDLEDLIFRLKLLREMYERYFSMSALTREERKIPSS